MIEKYYVWEGRNGIEFGSGKPVDIDTIELELTDDQKENPNDYTLTEGAIAKKNR